MAYVVARALKDNGADRQAAVEEFAAVWPCPPFRDRVHPRHPDAGEYGLMSASAWSIALVVRLAHEGEAEVAGFGHGMG
ncbi:hypothetical protein AB0G06_39045 [Nonomuraea dietziae]|uniref:hypothetical protein n=1 Tax=Nonomuraea dietziae TaxID=65515 RepID=UPI00340D371C